MKLAVGSDELRSLLESPSPAALTIYREDGEAITSPVWFRTHDDAFEIVMAATDRKLAHLLRDPRCLLLIFEASPPFRGIVARTQATLARDEGSAARLAIASRYLGADLGAAYADPELREPGWVVRVPMSAARAWSLADSIG